MDHKKCFLRFEAGDSEVCFQLQAEENLRIRIWIVTSKFENVCEQTHLEIITLCCFCGLRAKSVQHYAILDGYHHSGYFSDFLEAFKQTHKVRPKTPRESFLGLLSLISSKKRKEDFAFPKTY